MNANRHTLAPGRNAPASVRSIAEALALVSAIALAGCANIERSRDVGNPDVAGKTLALQVCSNCHGVDGNSASPNFPRLAGQPTAYIELQLKSFRAHQRSDPAGFVYMWGLSRKLTDAQIAGIAAHFHDSTPTANPAGSGPKAAAGKTIFEQGVSDEHVPACASCHGENAQGHDEFPRLAGQHAGYVRKQLDVFQRTEQRPEGPLMKAVAHELKPEEIAAVADYVQGMASR